MPEKPFLTLHRIIRHIQFGRKEYFVKFFHRLVFLITVCGGLAACGPFLSARSKGGGQSGKPYHVLRVATTAEVSSQSTQPLFLWEGGIANTTTNTLVIDKLVFRFDTDMTNDDLRERSPRATLTFGSLTRTVDLTQTETGVDEFAFLDLNARLEGLNEPIPQVTSIDDVDKVGPYARVLTIRVFFTGFPPDDKGNQVQVTLVRVVTNPQIVPGVPLDPNRNQPAEWAQNSPGFAVRWDPL